MAIGWLTVFKAIPWSDVVAAAPTVVKGARKLVDAVRKRGGEGEAPDGPEGEAAADPAARMAVRHPLRSDRAHPRCHRQRERRRPARR